MTQALRDTPAVARPTSAGSNAPRGPGDEIDLLAYAHTCWRYRYVLLASVLVVGAATYAINRATTPTYEATFRLMASEPRLDNEPERSIGIVAFREFVESPSEAAALITEFGLDRPPHNLTPARFLNEDVDVDVIRDSTIIRVAVRMKDRDLLVRVARRYAERVVATAQRLNVEGIEDMTRRIKDQRDTALDRLKTIDRAVEDYQRRSQIEVLQHDVDAMLARRTDALDLVVQIQGERARVRQAEADLAKQQQVRTVPRAVDPVRDDRGGQDADGLKIRSDVLDPYVNPVYDALQRDLTQARAKLAALEQQRRELVDRLQLDAPSAARLNRLYEAEAGLAALQRDQEVAQTAYLNAANKYEDAQLQSTVRTPRLHILDAALPPDRAVAPRTRRNTLAAMFLALTLGAIAVIAIDASKRGAADRS
jgi:uncharacterized protein involved in exopolysaccharide biosynthesis